MILGHSVTLVQVCLILFIAFAILVGVPAWVYGWRWKPKTAKYKIVWSEDVDLLEGTSFTLEGLASYTIFRGLPFHPSMFTGGVEYSQVNTVTLAGVEIDQEEERRLLPIFGNNELTLEYGYRGPLKVSQLILEEIRRSRSFLGSTLIEMYEVDGVRVLVFAYSYIKGL